ncbi:hypothetical protein SRB17_71790 [Streptomyces sp. RB17]|uniref:hypothetical protein n=1 Tax=Streptomyces sp. RB17 TaxID=2585197 RepID=UPI001296D332|nr:hypothetical protein [Streptomyces sp. RB17]MQY39157.1 hypothetical protein [Streptomyces sp. RB17]
MKKHALRAIAVLSVSTAVITGCSGAHKEGSTRPSATSAARAQKSSQPESPKAVAAEKVKNALEANMSADEDKFGSGASSPCSTSSARMFTAECGAAARATSDVAALALREINGRAGFTTLTSTAHKLQTAVREYERLGCASGPAAAETRRSCLPPAAVIAQGFQDLRDGANLALAGK